MQIYLLGNYKYLFCEQLILGKLLPTKWLKIVLPYISMDKTWRTS